MLRVLALSHKSPVSFNPYIISLLEMST
jgi:hypothetical protein